MDNNNSGERRSDSRLSRRTGSLFRRRGKPHIHGADPAPQDGFLAMTHSRHSRFSLRYLGAAVFAVILSGPVAADSSEPGATTDLSQLSLETPMSIEAYGASKFMQKITESPTAVSIVTARDIKSTATAHRQDILGGIKDAPVLMLGDSKGYASQGAAINFYLEGNKVRFEINMGAAARNGLEISPQLLKMARILRESGVREVLEQLARTAWITASSCRTERCG